MKASETQLLRFMSSSMQRFEIPIFQRKYSWTREHCKQLWDDIVQVEMDTGAQHHFIGSIIYIHEGLYQVTTTQRMLVIDGQQRLTTVSLFLLALASADKTLSDEILEDYLLNKRQRGDSRYKLGLTRSDRETFYNLVDNRDAPADASKNILDNYKYFEEQIDKAELDTQSLYLGLRKLLIVDVSLDRDHDDPQRIFESLNSTGISLFESDKIRNFVLLNLSSEDQEVLYNDHWYPMEKRFEQPNLPVRAIDEFIKNYVTAKTEVTPKKQNVYLDFRKYVLSSGRSAEQVVEELKIYSSYDMYWYFPGSFADPIVSETLKNLKMLDVNVAWPLSMNLFDDYERHQLLKIEELREILQMVEVYVFRRAIVGLATNSRKTTFASILGNVDKCDYLNSIKSAFLSPPWPRPWPRRFPDDNEFRDAFVSRPLYQEVSTRLPYLLAKLENHGRKEQVSVSNLSIEHILPQSKNLRQEWKEMLGENWRGIRDRYVHTVGNLTLTGYNSNLSDRPFLDKRDLEGGFADSPLRLNRGVGHLDTWGEAEILERADRLFEKAQLVWPYPQLDA